MAVFCLAFMSNAQNQEISTQQSTEIASEEVKAELVATVDGIEVFYVKSDQNGNILLDIEFKNTTNKSVSFTWSVVRENGLSYGSTKSITVRPGESFTKAAALEMKGSLNYTSYPITITLK